MKHYGKPLENLTTDEKKLMVLDNKIVEGFEILSTIPLSIEGIILKKILEVMSVERKVLTVQLLGLNERDFDTVEDLLNHIETTPYGFNKFLEDRKKNMGEVEMSELVQGLCMN